MRARGILLIMALCVLLPAVGTRPPVVAALCPLPPQLELEIRAPSADNLPLTMQHAVDAVRGALGVSAAAAPADGVSLEPLVASRGSISGYSATNRLTLAASLMRDQGVFFRAQAAAGRFGARASIVDRGTHQPRPDAWMSQWLRDG